MGLLKAQFRKEIMIFNRYLNPNHGKLHQKKNRKMGFETIGKPLSCLTIFSGLNDKEKLRKKSYFGVARLLLSYENRWLFSHGTVITPLNLVGL